MKKISGFTLIEILVALAIFSVVISMVVGIFISGSNSQRKILELHTVQREGSYLMETVSRELRTAVDISPTQENNNDSNIEFTNYVGKLVRYCKAEADGSCSSSGKYFSRNGDLEDSTSSNEIINSSDITIEYLRFYVTDDFSTAPRKQPIVTIAMKIKSTGAYKTELELQSSVAMRLYYY